MDESDEALMIGIADGDRTAFRMLLERHMRRSIALAQNTVRHSGQAEDIAQEAFMRVWTHATSFDPRRARFTTWLHRIVINLCIDYVRRPAHVSDDELELIADEAPDALGAALSQEQRRAVEDAMCKLPVRQRAALALFHFQELSGRDCAASMQLTESAFESLLTRARASLRELLQTYIADTKGDER